MFIVKLGNIYLYMQNLSFKTMYFEVFLMQVNSAIKDIYNG